MEELVNKLAELQAELRKRETRADEESRWIDEIIQKAEEELKALLAERAEARLPYKEAAEELKTTIGDLYGTIIDEWSGEKKTLEFDAGTLKFRTTTSVDVQDGGWLLESISARLPYHKVYDEYIKGFNLTAVRKYIDVIEVPEDVVKLVSKTTVKFDQESG